MISHLNAIGSTVHRSTVKGYGIGFTTLAGGFWKLKPFRAVLVGIDEEDRRGQPEDNDDEEEAVLDEEQTANGSQENTKRGKYRTWASQGRRGR